MIDIQTIGLGTGGTGPGEVDLDQGQSQGQEDDIHLQDQGHNLQGHLGQVQGHTRPDLVQGQDQGGNYALISQYMKDISGNKQRVLKACNDSVSCLFQT